MIKCKECGGEVSSKADVCPKCGVKLKAMGNGCVVVFSKLMGGLGAIIGAMVAISYLSTGANNDPVKELESRCQTISESYPVGSEKSSFYSSCVSSGKEALKSAGLNN